MEWHRFYAIFFAVASAPCFLWKCQITTKCFDDDDDYSSKSSKFLFQKIKLFIDKLRCNLSAWDLFANISRSAFTKSGKVKKRSICEEEFLPPTECLRLISIHTDISKNQPTFISLLRLILNHELDPHATPRRLFCVCSRALISGIISSSPL